MDRAQAEVAYFEAPAGERLVAAEFSIVGTGTGTYHDAGYSGAKVIDSTGKKYIGKPGSPTVGESLDLSLVLQPGERAAGWIVFDVPEGAKITAVTYQMDATGSTRSAWAGGTSVSDSYPVAARRRSQQAATHTHFLPYMVDG
ncbi:hypothetical protein [Streptomyces yatensis]|uniref:DUF4352 domain-containing protein n=1 Tax=Streptomyces yatensis TaxID=155177 RepID=A0ABP4U5A9_9ACTN|nr:hypothetical protein [Streptomyces yatensis]